MTRIVALVVVVLGLALLGRLDRDGRLVRTGAVAGALGYEVRVEVTLVRTGADSVCADSLARAATDEAKEAGCE